MKVLVACSYYWPYVSGVSECARLVAQGLVARGHSVTVVTVKHDGMLSSKEVHDGVQVLRAPLIRSVGRAPLSPRFAPMVRKLASTADVVHLHLPMADALALGSVATSARTIVTYHCDIPDGPGWRGKLQALAMDRASRRVLDPAERIVASSMEYARASRILPYYLDKTIEIPPLPKEPLEQEPRYAKGWPTVGFVGRWVPEKGLPFLLRAWPKLHDEFPQARLLLAGERKRVAGGTKVGEELKGLLPRDGSVEILGALSETDLWSFYRSLDVLVLSSASSVEAFGIVQVEAMLCGVPVVVSDLPGVRVPVAQTGMGLVVEPANPEALGIGISTVLRNKRSFSQGQTKAKEIYSQTVLLDRYESALGL